MTGLCRTQLELQWLLGKKALEEPRSFPPRYGVKKLRLPPSPPESTVRDEDRVGGSAPLHLIERMREPAKKRTGSGH
jgi:hypothetical protein